MGEILPNDKKTRVRIAVALWLFLPLVFFSGLWIFHNRLAFGYAGAGGISIPIFFPSPSVSEPAEIPVIQKPIFFNNEREVIIQGESGMQSNPVVQGSVSSPRTLISASSSQEGISHILNNQNIRSPEIKKKLSQPVLFSKKFDLSSQKKEEISSIPGRVIFSVKIQFSKTIKFLKKVGARTISF